MPITIDPKVEARLRERAAAEGLSIEAYVERLVNAEQAAEEELEVLALEGLNSGEPIEVGPNYWEEKHRRLDERLKKTGTRGAKSVMWFARRPTKTSTNKPSTTQTKPAPISDIAF